MSAKNFIKKLWISISKIFNNLDDEIKKNLPIAISIVEALKNGEKIAIYSDYDCDGIPGGVLLRTFFDDIGYPVEIYIPHRHNEGYGVHTHALDALKERGVTLVITIDSGITNIEEVAYAKSIGVDMIVTDHHLPITANAEDMQKERGTNAENTEKDRKSVV